MSNPEPAADDWDGGVPVRIEDARHRRRILTAVCIAPMAVIAACPGFASLPDAPAAEAARGIATARDPAQADPAQADPAQADPAQADPARAVVLRQAARGAFVTGGQGAPRAGAKAMVPLFLFALFRGPPRAGAHR